MRFIKDAFKSDILLLDDKDLTDLSSGLEIKEGSLVVKKAPRIMDLICKARNDRLTANKSHDIVLIPISLWQELSFEVSGQGFNVASDGKSEYMGMSIYKYSGDGVKVL